jgi:DNA (cytosine-5)-methyltransferase 1
MLIEGDRIRSRLLSTREAARLMGLPESYQLPAHYNEAYHLLGDGLVVPVVSWLEQHLLTPLAVTIATASEPRGHSFAVHPSTQSQRRILEPV